MAGNRKSWRCGAWAVVVVCVVCGWRLEGAQREDGKRYFTVERIQRLLQSRYVMLNNDGESLRAYWEASDREGRDQAEGWSEEPDDLPPIRRLYWTPNALDDVAPAWPGDGYYGEYDIYNPIRLGVLVKELRDAYREMEDSFVGVNEKGELDVNGKRLKGQEWPTDEQIERDPAGVFAALTGGAANPPAITIYPHAVTWKVGEEGKEKTVRIQMGEKANVKVLSVRSSSDTIAVEVKEVKENKEYLIVMKPKSTEGAVEAEVGVTTDKPTKGPWTYVLRARVVKVAGAADERR